MVCSIHFLLLVGISHLETFLGNVLGLLSKILTHALVSSHDMIRVSIDYLSVLGSSLLVNPTLLFFLSGKIPLVIVHHSLVFISPLFDLVSEFRMLLSNLDLFLQPLFFVM